MIEEIGNFWTMSADFRCITTNGALRRNGWAIMGKGMALEARMLHPSLESKLGSLIRQYGNHVFDLGNGLISFPTKTHWKSDSNIELIKRSAQELVTLLQNNPARRILLTRPGCGNGNLKWDSVKPAIQDILNDNKFMIIHNDYTLYQEKCAAKYAPSEKQWEQ